MGILRNYVFPEKLIWLFTIFLTITSCTKNEVLYENAAGILTCKFQLPDGRVFDCVIDQANLTIENSKDSVLYGTSDDILRNIKLIFTTTLGAEVKIDNVDIVNGVTEVNLNAPLLIDTKYKDAKRSYQMTLNVEKIDHAEIWGAKINTDMRMTGLPSFNSYSAALYKDHLYILGARYPGGTLASATAYYELYKSADGTFWEKVETNPNVIGGFGAELIVFNDKLFAIGGARLYGIDINGTKAETSIAWRIMSTTDGINWTDCTGGIGYNPMGRAFAQVCVHDGKLVLRRGKRVAFNSWQNVTEVFTSQTSDGTNWTMVMPTSTLATNRTDDAMFSFDNKLWIVGGYASFINESQMRPSVYSSADNGINWVQSIPTSNMSLNVYGHRVVTNGEKLYMIGGERFENNERIGMHGASYSNNAIDWYPLDEDIQLPASYSTRIYPSLFMGSDNTIWILGGFAKSNGNYSISGITMDFRYDVWTKKLK